MYRGGGWDHDASRGRASYRAWDDPGCRAVHHGFRLAMSLPLGSILKLWLPDAERKDQAAGASGLDAGAVSVPAAGQGD